VAVKDISILALENKAVYADKGIKYESAVYMEEINNKGSIGGMCGKNRRSVKVTSIF